MINQPYTLGALERMIACSFGRRGMKSSSGMACMNHMLHKNVYRVEGWYENMICCHEFLAMQLGHRALQTRRAALVVVLRVKTLRNRRDIVMDGVIMGGGSHKSCGQEMRQTGGGALLWWYIKKKKTVSGNGNAVSLSTAPRSKRNECPGTKPQLSFFLKTRYKRRTLSVP